MPEFCGGNVLHRGGINFAYGARDIPFGLFAIADGDLFQGIGFAVQANGNSRTTFEIDLGSQITNMADDEGGVLLGPNDKMSGAIGLDHALFRCIPDFDAGTGEVRDTTCSTCAAAEMDIPRNPNGVAGSVG